jgi:hypothetical protein
MDLSEYREYRTRAPYTHATERLASWAIDVYLLPPAKGKLINRF